jgi:hypothetical protein
MHISFSFPPPHLLEGKLSLDPKAELLMKSTADGLPVSAAFDELTPARLHGFFRSTVFLAGNSCQRNNSK